MRNINYLHLPIKLFDFIKAQSSAIIYGSIQIGALAALFFVPNSILPANSIFTLGTVTTVSFGSLVGAHLFLRRKDVDDIMLDILKHVRKFAGKMPILRNTRLAHKVAK